MVLPLQGVVLVAALNPGRCLGLGGTAPAGRYGAIRYNHYCYLTGITSSASWSRGDERRTRMSCGRLPSAFSGAPPSGPKPC